MSSKIASGFSFFGSWLQILRSRESSTKQAKTTKYANYEDDLKLLLDAVVLANGNLLKDGFIIKPVGAEPGKAHKRIIRGLHELEKDTPYITEKGTAIYRSSEYEVVMGGGKVTLPVFEAGMDWQKSKSVIQYCMRGALNPDTLVIAIENFTHQKIDQGMLFYEQNKKLGRIFFDFKDISPQVIYVTPEDTVMLKRESESTLVQFTFGRNLFWYSYDKQNPITKPDAVVKEPSKLQQKKTEEIHERLRSRALALAAKNRRGSRNGTPTKGIGRHSTLATTATRSAATLAGQQQLADALAAAANHAVVGGDGAPPPPPPPPPHFKRNGPPPPPGQGPFSPMANDGVKKRKLRQLNWSAIPRHKIDNTFWRDASSPTKLASFGVSESEIEDLFSLSPIKRPESDKKTETAPKPGKKTILNILGLKRANNTSILLSQFKMSHAEIRDAIVHVNDDAFTPEQLISLKYLFPLSDQEKRDLAGFKGDVECLSEADKFYYEMREVADPDIKINLMVFRQQFRGSIDDIALSATNLSKACEELQLSKKFSKVLQLILKLGSILNRASTGASSAGFRLETLNKLADTKAKNGQTTALDYVVQVITKAHPELLDFDQEIASVPVAAKLAVESITEDVKEMGRMLKSLEKELSKRNGVPSKLTVSGTKEGDKENNPNADNTLPADHISKTGHLRSNSSTETERFITVMKPFYEESAKIFMDVERKVAQSVHSFNSLVTFFGDDAKKTNPEQFFGQVATFINDFKKAQAKAIGKPAAQGGWRKSANVEAEQVAITGESAVAVVVEVETPVVEETPESATSLIPVS